MDNGAGINKALDRLRKKIGSSAFQVMGTAALGTAIAQLGPAPSDPLRPPPSTWKPSASGATVRPSVSSSNVFTCFCCAAFCNCSRSPNVHWMSVAALIRRWMADFWPSRSSRTFSLNDEILAACLEI